ncbi:hypothetical protein B0H63DRAFT_518510 [Podospora didyma]|uniref:Uncharacterized protein n=1 Tax=Podospora didyma TaxID=330526 RepID=A0AAE0U361_9PEZI|nr:hypothetical protein B0H63DRAFT_518510 [Podospora didyma]
MAYIKYATDKVQEEDLKSSDSRLNTPGTSLAHQSLEEHEERARMPIVEGTSATKEPSLETRIRSEMENSPEENLHHYQE